MLGRASRVLTENGALRQGLESMCSRVAQRMETITIETVGNIATGQIDERTNVSHAMTAKSKGLGAAMSGVVTDSLKQVGKGYYENPEAFGNITKIKDSESSFAKPLADMNTQFDPSKIANWKQKEIDPNAIVKQIIGEAKQACHTLKPAAKAPAASTTIDVDLLLKNIKSFTVNSPADSRQAKESSHVSIKLKEDLPASDPKSPKPR